MVAIQLFALFTALASGALCASTPREESSSPEVIDTSLNPRGAEAIIDGILSVIGIGSDVGGLALDFGIFDGLEVNNEKRSIFTQNMVDMFQANDSNFNFVIVHGKHTVTWEGIEGTDWMTVEIMCPLAGGREMKFIGTGGKRGVFELETEDKPANWAWGGHTARVSTNGKKVHFLDPSVPYSDISTGNYSIVYPEFSYYFVAQLVYGPVLARPPDMVPLNDVWTFQQPGGPGTPYTIYNAGQGPDAKVQTIYPSNDAPQIVTFDESTLYNVAVDGDDELFYIADASSGLAWTIQTDFSISLEEYTADYTQRFQFWGKGK